MRDWSLWQLLLHVLITHGNFDNYTDVINHIIMTHEESRFNYRMGSSSVKQVDGKCPARWEPRLKLELPNSAWEKRWSLQSIPQNVTWENIVKHLLQL